MSTPVETKTCAMCAETIKAAAKKCPFCQTRLSFFGLWWSELGAGLVALIWVIAAVAGAAWLLPDWTRSEGRSFAGHRSELPVPRIALDGPDQRSEFWVSGYVTNSGTYPWRVRDLEVRFLNPDGSLLEVRHPHLDNPFVVQPGGEHAFRVSVGRLLEPVVRADLSARALEAIDGNRPPGPD